MEKTDLGLNYDLMATYYGSCAALEEQIINSSLTEEQKNIVYSLIDEALDKAHQLGRDSAK